MYDERSGGDVCLQAIFGQVHMDAKPTLKDSTGALYPYYPNEARIRNLTYQIEASVDFTIEKRRRYGNKPGTAKEDLIETYETKEKTTLCKIPVMVHSKPCQLFGQTPKMIMRKKECLYDQGGYFVINGSEKVIVALSLPVHRLARVASFAPPEGYLAALLVLEEHLAERQGGWRHRQLRHSTLRADRHARHRVADARYVQQNLLDVPPLLTRHELRLDALLAEGQDRARAGEQRELRVGLVRARHAQREPHGNLARVFERERFRRPKPQRGDSEIQPV